MSQFKPVFIEKGSMNVGYAESHIEEDKKLKLPFQLELVKNLEAKIETLQLDVNLLRQALERLEKKIESTKNP